MQNPMNYKTSFGLFNCFIKILQMPSSCKKGWLLDAAYKRAEELDPELIKTFRRLQGEASPKTISSLEIRG